MTNSADPDQFNWLIQKPTDLDLHCMQSKKGIAGLNRTRVRCVLTEQIFFSLMLYMNKHLNVMLDPCG